MTTAKGPGGQPSKIDQIVGTTPEGAPVTAADRIIQGLNAGDYVESAAAAAGIDKASVYHWMRTGARTIMARERALALDRPTPKTTTFEDRCVEFSNSVTRATAEWHQRTLATLEGLARGGRKVTTTTTKVLADGTQEITTKVEELEPNAAVLMWRLTRRFPQKYSPRLDVDVHTGDADPWRDDNEGAADLADSLAGEIEGFTMGAAAALDVSSVESEA